MGWANYSPACDRHALIGDPALDLRHLMLGVLPARGPQWAGALGAPDPPPRDPEAARATLRALGWVFPEVDPDDGAVLRRERRIRCDVGDAARSQAEQAVVAAVRAAQREGEG